MGEPRGAVAAFVARHERWIIALFLAGGIVLRLAWAYLKPAPGKLGEAYNVAVSLATGAGFANAMGPGTGPTAHLTPGMVLISGLVYRIFGIHTPASELLLTCVALLVVLGGYLLAYHLFRRLGIPLLYRLGALGFLCIAPIYPSIEALDFKLWEGGLAVLAQLFVLLLFFRHDGLPPGRAAWFFIPLATAVSFLISPTLGLGTYLCWLIFMFRNFRGRNFFAVGIVSTILLVLVLTPWTIRNEVMMGKPIPLRDNLGLELAVSFYPGAEVGEPTMYRYWTRLREIHPYNSAKAFAAMQAAGGELAYAEKLQKETFAWIAGHPTDAARLALRHSANYVMPPAWQYQMKANSVGSEIRHILMTIVALLGYGCALWALTRPGPWLYFGFATLMKPVAYFMVEPIPRYMWLNYTSLIFLSAAALYMIGSRLSRMRARSLPS